LLCLIKLIWPFIISFTIMSSLASSRILISFAYFRLWNRSIFDLTLQLFQWFDAFIQLNITTNMMQISRIKQLFLTLSSRNVIRQIAMIVLLKLLRAPVLLRTLPHLQVAIEQQAWIPLLGLLIIGEIHVGVNREQLGPTVEIWVLI